MMRARLLLLLLLSLCFALPAAAQESTETPETTETPIPTVTPTPTPEMQIVWTLQPSIEGEPGQAVALVYQMTVGDVINAVLLFALFVLGLVSLTLYLLRRSVPR